MEMLLNWRKINYLNVFGVKYDFNATGLGEMVNKPVMITEDQDQRMWRRFIV